MLRQVNPLLSPDLLHILASMGHGDDLVIVNANFPGDKIARKAGARYTRLDGAPAPEVLRAVLEHLPVDDFVKDPFHVMQVPDPKPPILSEFETIIRDVADHPAELTSIDRFAFYDRASTAYAVVQTGERRLYGNIIIKKGIIRL
ncbi:RbsD/FucU domain-containing protein [uncultured Cohaesibacter sp.]|uniref:RbsD/FucU family protein n=1 Tax=uncultured Cohaesibacter sp. TaxID=1002546 RepID=UPI0029C79A32|nr:RbsD/FucU domain-containing protein [uncultured Cohaesibacter sp.]